MRSQSQARLHQLQLQYLVCLHHRRHRQATLPPDPPERRAVRVRHAFLSPRKDSQTEQCRPCQGKIGGVRTRRCTDSLVSDSLEDTMSSEPTHDPFFAASHLQYSLSIYIPSNGPLISTCPLLRLLVPPRNRRLFRPFESTCQNHH